jgi:peptidylprolyl isomerase
MRRYLLAMLLLLAGAIMAGCGGNPGPVPAVNGKFGSDPVITIPNGNPSRSLIVQTLIQGSGPAVKPSDYVLFNVQGKVWVGDRQVVDSYTNHQPQGLPLSTTLPAWRQLAGQQVGSRVMMVVPPKDGFGPKGNPAANIQGGDTLVFVFDVLGTMPDSARASGTVIPYHPGPGMPAVGFGPHGPVITVPSNTAPPGNLVSQVLIRGHGQPIVAGDTVVTQYTGVVWRTGKMFDSSWSRKIPQSFVLGAGQVIPGWEQGLGGLPIGSRVLLVIPPALAYNRAANPPYIKSGDTLAFVIDIVAAVRP